MAATAMAGTYANFVLFQSSSAFPPAAIWFPNFASSLRWGSGSLSTILYGCLPSADLVNQITSAGATGAPLHAKSLRFRRQVIAEYPVPITAMRLPAISCSSAPLTLGITRRRSPAASAARSPGAAMPPTPTRFPVAVPYDPDASTTKPNPVWAASLPVPISRTSTRKDAPTRLLSPTAIIASVFRRRPRPIPRTSQPTLTLHLPESRSQAARGSSTASTNCEPVKN
mmetsp:Transcript_105112/g.322232  ORF Transcript_105112/g.322232 Transcript_105112/m.322232 type:complete len:227 (+) Transcript_105112:544-1224(+)